MVHSVLMVALVLTAPPSIPPPQGDEVVSAASRLEQVFARSAPIHGGLSEGPAAAIDGTIYFSDIPMGADRGMILRFDPQRMRTTVFTDDSHKSNGLAFADDGTLIACEGADGGGRCLARWDVRSGKRSVIVDRYHGKRFNAPNDLCIDRRGRIYVTDPKYVGPEQRELEHRAVYRVDSDGSVSELTHALSKPNGLVLSPDERTLYVADTDNGSERIEPNAPPSAPGPMKVFALTLDVHGRVIDEPRSLIDFGIEPGCDGMTVDSRGRLYLAVRTPQRPGVMVLDPVDSHEVAFIPTGPANQQAANAVGLPSNVEFGRGAERGMLYITVDQGLWRIALRAVGRRE
ncbi:MAG TPA: SMP-30/gluconolactonase/LRE family protein [Pirellulales bacterium]|jgi:gluconolactonase|nr:SMP-30/gluconolactonase/LRE family protein [Pirellulales bacterium]